MSPNGLFSRREIQQLAEQFPQYRAELQRCVEQLSRENAEQDHLVAAVRKSFRVNTGKLNVFVSYKRTQHGPAAHALLKVIQALGGPKVNVFLDHAKIPCGRNWYDTIKENVHQANCFILLVPDDSDEREWPIFEAGIFAGRMLPGDRLICLHHPMVTIPSQLEAFQGIVADLAGLTQLLRTLLVEPDLVPGLPPINPGADSLIAEQAASVAKLFIGPRTLKARPTMSYVKLALETPGQLRDVEDLLSATVLAARGLAEMFGYTGGPGCQLREVLSAARGGDLEQHQPWLKEIAEVGNHEVRRSRAPVPFAKFATPDGTKFYRPVLSLVEEDAQRVVHRVELSFGEHLSDTTGEPDDIKLMETVLRLCGRFRAELLVPFRNARRPEDVRRAQQICERIERESYDEGFRDRKLLLPLFGTEERKRIDGMYDEWETMRRQDRTGRLDLAFAASDADEFRECLKVIRRNTRDFLILAAHRYAEMVEEVAY
jgi:hypothetical protein